MEKEKNEIIELKDEELVSVSVGSYGIRLELDTLIDKIDTDTYVDFNGKKLLNGFYNVR
ncbi:MAG: hypothetical protein MJ250_03030 [Alphaproteobacteria bacterium]|nr:hypothetical protein [Alphaproteobacteria bacterium]